MKNRPKYDNYFYLSLFPLEKCNTPTRFPLEKCNVTQNFPLEKCKKHLDIPLEKCIFATKNNKNHGKIYISTIIEMEIIRYT